MHKKYTHLFFDLDNTIWDFDSNSYDALQAALKNIGLLDKIGSYSEFYKIFYAVNEQLWSMYHEGKMPQSILRIQRFEESFEKNGTPFHGVGELLNEAYVAEMPGSSRLIDGAGELLEYLHNRYEMAIITNGFKDIQYKKINRAGLKKYFKKFFISEEIGARKPKKEIFEHAIKSMNARKKSSLMIGDSWEADIMGAMNIGIDQIYFCPGLNLNNQNQSTANNTSTITISALTDLFKIL